MTINLDMLEAVYLICSMLLEIPSLVKRSFAIRKKSLSKPFKKLLDFYDRQVFSGPPENTRDHINAASRALMKGDWKTCFNVIKELNVWNLMINSNQVLEMTKTKIKIAALRTFLFAYSRNYETIHLEKLMNLFELDSRTIHSVVSKMMIKEEFYASWDQPTNSIIMHNVEPSKLQYLALQIAEKTENLIEYNERLIDSGDKGEQKKQQQKSGRQRKTNVTKFQRFTKKY